MIVGALEKFSIALVGVLFLVGLIAGYQAGGVGGAIVGLVFAFLIAVLFFGILFIQLEMNESLRAIRNALEKPQKYP
ncbi:MAG: hypothetical protein EA406_02960 [Rhodospirillales bacterium]|nr:MAG: hypothetical protein EA406_02960 [Rhodospirillales bacterium]